MTTRKSTKQSKTSNSGFRLFPVTAENLRLASFTTRLRLFRSFAILLTLICLVSPLGWAEPDYEKIVQAIWLSEGGLKAKKPFGILSIPCADYTACRQIAVNTVHKNYQRWLMSDRSFTYLEFLANRYAPISDSPLNENWLRNVNYFMDRL